MNITINTKEVIESVKGVADNQIPFATALALTRTAQDVQAEIRRELPKRFTIRNNFVAQGIVIEKATKKNLVAIVKSRDDFMVLQETGGIKTPRGRSIAVPQSIRRNKRDIVTQANRPRQILNKPRVFEATIGGHHGIWQQTSKRDRRLKLLYSLVPSVPIKPRFRFEDTARRVAQERFERQFAIAFAEAIRTAR